MSEETPWRPLKEVAARCERSGIWSDKLNDILRSGRVPMRGKRIGHVRDPIEDLLRRASYASLVGEPDWSVWFLPALNMINLSRRDVNLWFGPGMPPAPVTFTDVVVHWPKLVEELQTDNFTINSEPSPPPRSPGRGRNADALPRAPARQIHNAITQAYDDAAAAGEKPPNIREVVAPVQVILRETGYQASGNQIQQLAADSRHAGRRRKIGVTVASERSRQR